jgi:hypothetical protein
MARHGRQRDLLDWVPPEPVVRFDERTVRAATVAGKLCRGISQALKDCGRSRADVAKAVTEFLGEDMSTNMLNAYASEARDDHVINVVRFIGLIHATGDRRLLELIADMFGWIVMERKYLPLIELASLREKEDEISRQRDMLRRQAKNEGLL